MLVILSILIHERREEALGMWFNKISWMCIYFLSEPQLNVLTGGYFPHKYTIIMQTLGVISPNLEVSKVALL